jgi:cytidyltransferase-like protein
MSVDVSNKDNCILRVYTDMVADLPHFGHWNLLKRIRDHWKDQKIYLIVGINSDSYVQSYKRLPYMTQEERMHAISVTGLADEVIIAPNQMTLSLSNEMKFDFICHGDDVTMESFKIKWDKSTIEEQQNMFYDLDLINSGKYISMERTSDFGISTSMLIERILNRHKEQ